MSPRRCNGAPHSEAAIRVHCRGHGLDSRSTIAGEPLRFLQERPHRYPELEEPSFELHRLPRPQLQHSLPKHLVSRAPLFDTAPAISAAPIRSGHGSPDTARPTALSFQRAPCKISPMRTPSFRSRRVVLLMASRHNRGSPGQRPPNRPGVCTKGGAPECLLAAIPRLWSRVLCAGCYRQHRFRKSSTQTWAALNSFSTTSTPRRICHSRVDGYRPVLTPTSGVAGSLATVSGRLPQTGEGGQLVPTTSIDVWWNLNPQHWEGTLTGHPQPSVPGLVFSLSKEGARNRCTFRVQFHIPTVPPGAYPVVVLYFGGGGTASFEPVSFHVR